MAQPFPNSGMPSNSGAADDTGAPVHPVALPHIATSTSSTTTQDLLDDVAMSDQGMPAMVGSSDVPAQDPDSGSEDEEDETVKHVKRLLRQNGTTYAGHIKSFDDFDRLRKAHEKSLRKKAEHDRRVINDMPQDDAGLQELAIRLRSAITNLEDIETNLTRKHVLKGGKVKIIDAVGTKAVKEMKPFELELLAWSFLAAIRDAQHGLLELPHNLKTGVKFFTSFMERFAVVEECLKANKNLVKDAVHSKLWVNQIVADPRLERARKVENERLARKKAEAAERAKQQQQQSGAATTGTKRQASADLSTNKRTRLSTSSGVEPMQAQSQPGLEQRQQPQQHFNAFSQQVGTQSSEPQLQHGDSEQHGDSDQHGGFDQDGGSDQYGHAENGGHAGQYGNPHGDPQQLGTPQPSGTHLQTEDGQALEQRQHHSGNILQLGGVQQLNHLASHAGIPQNMSDQQHQQGGGSLQQQSQQPAAAPEIAAPGTAAAAPATHDGPKPALEVGDGTGQVVPAQQPTAVYTLEDILGGVASNLELYDERP